MDTLERYQAAIEKILPELPSILADDWSAFEQDLAYFLEQIEQAPDRATRQELIEEVDLLFFDHPAADKVLRAALKRLTTSPHDFQLPKSPPSSRGADESYDRQGLRSGGRPDEQQGQTVTRYTDISCPKHIHIDAPRVTAVVRLAMRPIALSVVTQALSLRSDLPVSVHISAPSFAILNGMDRKMAVHRDRDSEISVDLKPLAVGPTRITFDFLQGRNPVGTATIAVEVSAVPVASGADARLERLLRFEPGVPAPDLVLYVAYEQKDGMPRYVFTLYHAGDSIGETFQPVPVRIDPLNHSIELYKDLAGLAMDLASAGTLASQIKEIGQNLWMNLIPAALRQRFHENRAAWQGKTMLLLSDEPYIPWELVWPFDIRTGKDDDAPWAQSLNVTRWLRGDALSNGYDGPTSTLSLASLACLAPPDTDLPNVADERILIQRAVNRHRLRDATPATMRRQAVLELLRSGGYSWLHVATHGDFSDASPDDDAAIWLEGDEYLAPRNLVGGEILGSIYRNRPGFVFNACYGGRQGWALTRLGGWANRLIGTGAGLFLAPMWSVRDDLAYAFSEAFYATLLNGETAAEALLAGRQAAKRDGNPTWLAYSLYAHPNARAGVESKA